MRSFRNLALTVALSLAPLVAARPAAAAGPTVRTVTEHVSAKSPAYTGTLDVPQLTWASQPTVVGEVNLAIVQWVKGQVQAFASQVRSGAASAKGVPASLPESKLNISYRVSRLSTKVLSLRLTVASYLRGEANSNTTPDGLTFDLSNGAAYSLSSLFRPGAAYPAALARASASALKAFHPAGAQCYLAAPSAAAAASAAWWLSGNALVLAYPPGQYTVASCGTPTVKITARALRSLLAPGGPLT
jgi:hypothetical protein